VCLYVTDLTLVDGVMDLHAKPDSEGYVTIVLPPLGASQQLRSRIAQAAELHGLHYFDARRKGLFPTNDFGLVVRQCYPYSNFKGAISNVPQYDDTVTGRASEDVLREKYDVNNYLERKYVGWSLSLEHFFARYDQS